MDHVPTCTRADPGLTSDFVSAKSPVLAANQLLAEMAMIQLELPSERRGVVAMAPPGWAANPTFVSILLSGLEGHPLLDAVTASQLFAAVPPTSGIERSLVSSGSGAGGTGNNEQSPVAALVSDAQAIRYAREQVTGLGEILPGEAPLAATLGTDLLVAESTAITEAQRQSLLAEVGTSASKLISRISLPGSSSITLTSRRGQIPLTILSSTGQRANVQLQLTSQRLIFQPFNPPGGRCQVPTPTTEVCRLTLVSENTTIKVPVQTQASGVFPLTVALYSPDGSLPLPTDSDTVRSTRDLRRRRHSHRAGCGIARCVVDSGPPPRPAGPGSGPRTGRAGGPDRCRRRGGRGGRAFRPGGKWARRRHRRRSVPGPGHRRVVAGRKRGRPGSRVFLPAAAELRGPFGILIPAPGGVVTIETGFWSKVGRPGTVPGPDRED